MTEFDTQPSHNASSLEKDIGTEAEETKNPLLVQVETPASLPTKASSVSAKGNPFFRSLVKMVAHVAALLFCAYIIYLAWPGSSLFSWHPTLMVLAYAVAMFEAVLVFSPHSSLVGSLSRQTKVTIHLLFATTSAFLALGGLAIIFQVKENNQRPHYTSWHGLIGLITVGYSCMQLMGGTAVKYYSFSSRFIKMKLADLKMTHAVSGVAAFTLVTATMMLALYTSWLSERVEGLAWYACAMAVSWVGMVVVNQVTEAYGYRFRQRPSSRASVRK